MSEEATQTPASEGNPAAPGSPAEGSGGGVPAGYVPQAALDQAESRRRSMQSELDRERAARTSLEERLGKIEQSMTAFDPARVADEFTARFNQQQAIAAARSKAKEEYPLARADVFDRQFQTPEELIQAVQSSHNEMDELHKSIRAEAESKIFSELKEKHGRDFAPAPQTAPAEGEGGGKPPLTQADLASMPMDEFLALPQEVLDKVPNA